MDSKTTWKLSWFLIALLVFLSQTNRVEAFSGVGDGQSAETAFIITNCEQLQEMNNELDSFYKLGNNIDCSASVGWNANDEEWVGGIVGGTLIADPYTGVTNNGYYGFEPIGQTAVRGESLGFMGTLDGQGYTISNLWIFRKGFDFNGLIGYATNATIKNLTLSGADVVGAGTTGGFLGYGSGVTLENLTNNGGMVRAYLAYNGGGIAGHITNDSSAVDMVVSGGNVHGSGNVIGGLFGNVYLSSISSSTVSAVVDGGEYIGGAFGAVEASTIDDVSATGNVESNDGDDLYVSGFSKNGRYTGGFAGIIRSSLVNDVSATGIVTAEDSYAGGFAGLIQDSTQISNARATGNVTADSLAGGFAGAISSSTVEDSISTGDVNTLSGDAGGFAGQTSCTSSFLRVAAYGDVTADGDFVGGFTGSDGCEGPGSTFNQVAAHGNATSTGLYVGGFIGHSFYSTITNAYAGGNVTGNDWVGGFTGNMSNSDLANTYSRGVVAAGGPAERVGGFGGEISDTEITYSYTDSGTSGQESVCGVGGCAGAEAITTPVAKTELTYVFAGWNFDSIWQINTEVDGYPHFIWEQVATILPGSGTVGDPYQVTQCFTAGRAGYYQLQNDIEDVLGTCITVEADGVIIDGNGFTLRGNSEGNSGAGIRAVGYDSVRISDIAIETFLDGIQLYVVEGESVITDVTIASTTDDSIDLRGVNDVTISNTTITNPGDDGITARPYDESGDAIYNFNIHIQNVVIDGADDFGLNLDYVTTLRITDSEILNTDDDDGMSFYMVEDVQILDNTLTNIDGDGIYLENGTNVQISRNTITDTVNDGIDIDDDSDERSNTNFVITNNVLTDIGDNGIEIYDLQDATITGNTMEVFDEGIYISNSSDVDITGNTITPTMTEFFVIPSFVTNNTSINILDAESSLNTTYDYITYTLPFTFNYMGRNITTIIANVAGSIELLEDGESCQACGYGGTYRNSLFADTIFASYDAITTEGEGNYVAVFNQDDEKVIVEWRGSTLADSDSVSHPIHFQVVMHPTGDVEWNFMQMDFESTYNPMFTGAYDVEANELYRAGIDINNASSFRADLSGNDDFVSSSSFDPIVGFSLQDVSNSSFIGNDIRAGQWVDAIAIENVVFNDSDSGNTYRLTNGNGAWTVFDIVDTNGNGYAESGTDRPFNQQVLGEEYWSGEGEDLYPRSIASGPTTPTPTVSGFAVQSRVSGGSVSTGNSVFSIKKPAQVDKPINRPLVSTTRELQRFLNTNGFPVALSGPGSLNNETESFGTLTRQALIRFQRANGISPAVGIFGPITRAFINRTVSSSPTQNTTARATTSPTVIDNGLDLEVGSTGPSVVALQEILIKLGFKIPDGATGRFGQQTRNALASYQKANNIVPASGRLGPATRAYMKNTGIAGLWW